jgi:hypothetical protein
MPGWLGRKVAKISLNAEESVGSVAARVPRLAWNNTDVRPATQEGNKIRRSTSKIRKGITSMALWSRMMMKKMTMMLSRS